MESEVAEMNSLFYTSSCKDHSCQLNINTKHHAIPSAYFSYDCRILYSYTITGQVPYLVYISLTFAAQNERTRVYKLWKCKAYKFADGLSIIVTVIYTLNTCIYKLVRTLLEKDSFHAACAISCHCSNWQPGSEIKI